MQLKWILIVYNNGLPLFGYDVESRRSVLDNSMTMLNRICGFYNTMVYLHHYVLNSPIHSIYTDGLLWVMHDEKITHYQPMEIIEYSVIVVAEIEKQQIEIGSKDAISMDKYENILFQFAKEISLDFYAECAEEIVQFVMSHISMFNRFKPFCDRRVESFADQLSEAITDMTKLKESSQ